MGQAALLASLILLVTLAFGVSIFCGIEHQNFIDGLLNAMLVMTGLGLVNTVTTDAGKILTTIYALISAIALFSFLMILLGPLLHRLLHSLHVEKRGDKY